MQEYSKLTNGDIGFTIYEDWYCYSPVKNSLQDATTCLEKGLPSYGAAEAEFNFYNWTNKMFRLAGVQIEEKKDAE